MNIIFEFAGGPLDGKAVAGVQGQQDEADRYYALTHHGKVGQRFRIASDYAVEVLTREQLRLEKSHHFQPHYYRVTDRLEADSEVLVRAEYVEPPADERLATAPRESLSEAEFEERIRQRLRELLLDIRGSWTASYSHCWPAAPPLSPSMPSDALSLARHLPTPGGAIARASVNHLRSRHLALHLGHAVMLRNFAVFLDVRHPGFPGQELDLLALSPGQDWFLACRFPTLQGAEAASTLASTAQQLAAFWLGPHLTIAACQAYVGQVAKHCQRGYGLIAATYWVLDDQSATSGEDHDADLLGLWNRASAGERPAPVLRDAIPLDAVWSSPAVLGKFPGLGTCYLLAIYFPLPARGGRPAAGGHA